MAPHEVLRNLNMGLKGGRAGGRRVATRPSPMESFEMVLASIEATGAFPHLVQTGREAIANYKSTRSRCGKAARGKSGRKGIVLPWKKIDALRARKITWKEIAGRLQAAGYRISASTLSFRNKQRKRREQRRPLLDQTEGKAK